MFLDMDLLTEGEQSLMLLFPVFLILRLEQLVFLQELVVLLSQLLILFPQKLVFLLLKLSLLLQQLIFLLILFQLIPKFEHFFTLLSFKFCS